MSGGINIDSLVSSVEIYRTGVDTSHFSKEQLSRLDVDALKRTHLVIHWKDVNNKVCLLIRDLLKIQYSLPYKILNNVSYKYVSQKTNTNGDDTNIESANILIEPLNNDFKSQIRRMPINQKLEIGTEVVLNKSIDYNPEENGLIPDRKFLHSGNLVFSTSVPHPCPKFFHLGAMEIGSNIRAKFTVQLANPLVEKYRLFEFMRKDAKKVFVLQLWDYYGLNFSELLDMMIDYVEKHYNPVQYYTISANDYGNNVIDREGLAEFLSGLKDKVDATKPNEVSIDKLLDAIQK